MWFGLTGVSWGLVRPTERDITDTNLKALKSYVLAMKDGAFTEQLEQEIFEDFDTRDKLHVFKDMLDDFPRIFTPVEVVRPTSAISPRERSPVPSATVSRETHGRHKDRGRQGDMQLSHLLDALSIYCVV